MKALIPGIPSPLAPGLILIAGMMGFLVYDQQYWWDLKEDYTFGYIVPLFVAYILYDRWPRFQRLLGQPQHGPASGFASTLFNGLAAAAVAGGMLLFLFGAMMRGMGGPQTPASLALSVATACVTLGLVYLLLPKPDAPPAEGVSTGWFRNPRVETTMVFLFPALIWLVSAPLLGVVESNINIFLMNKVTIVVFNLFNFVGIPIIQEGNVLRLGEDNVVGVAEACSGIRSLTACIFAGSFLSAVFLETFPKKVTLLVAGALLAVFTNMLRSIFLTAWAYKFGSKAIEGTVHDVTGYAVLGVTTVLLLCLIPILNFKLKVKIQNPPPPAA